MRPFSSYVYVYSIALRSILSIYSANTHTFPSVAPGLNRYSLPSSAVNTAIAQPCLLTFTPSAEIATFCSEGVSTMSGRSEYGPRLFFILATSLTSPKSAVFTVPVRSVTVSTWSSSITAFTLLAPLAAALALAVAVSAFVAAVSALPVAV